MKSHVRMICVLGFALIAACGGDKQAQDPASKPTPKATEGEKAADKAGASENPKAQDKVAATNEKKGEAALPPAAAELKGKVEAAAVKAEALANTEAKALTQEAYEALVVALASCKINDEGAIAWDCPELKALNKARQAQTALKDIAGFNAGLGKKLLTHESPAVRIKAAEMMASMLGADDSAQRVVIDAIGKEKHPAVIKALLDVIGSSGGKNPEIGALLVKLADHESPLVRGLAIYWLASSWNKDVAGGIEKIIEKAEKDPDTNVRQSACKYGGKLGNDAMIPVYEKLTQDPDDDIYGACMEGLVEMWLSYPFFETASEKAYKLTLERLAAKPRTDNRPPWSLLGTFKHAGSSGDSIDKWRAKATWFNRDALVKVLGDVVVDEQANGMARTAAVESIGGLGVPKATIEGIAAKCKDASGQPTCNSRVVEALDKAAQAAK